MSTELAPTGTTTLPLQDLKAIVATLRTANPETATNEIWNDAAITGTFSWSSGGSNLEGWITLYDGKVFHFKLDNVTAKEGTVAGTFASPLIRVKPLGAMETGTFELGGMWVGGLLKLSCVKDPIAVVSVAPLNYYLAGTAKCTKA